MTIREATMADLDQVEALALRIGMESEPQRGVTVDAAHIRTVVAGCLENPMACGMLADDDGEIVGMCGLVLYTHPVSAALKAGEICWWVNPEARSGRVGLQLLAAAERWAESHGAESIQMTSADPKIHRVLARRNYESTETVYERILTCHHCS